MKKSDLKTGMIIETRAGNTGLVMLGNCYGQDAIVFAKDNWTPLDGFSDSLEWHKDDKERTDFCKTVDIVKVYEPDLPSGFLSRKSKFGELKVLWSREATNSDHMVDAMKYAFTPLIEMPSFGFDFGSLTNHFPKYSNNDLVEMFNEFQNEHCECEGDSLTSFQDFKFNEKDLEQFKIDKGLVEPKPQLEEGMYVKIIEAMSGAKGCNGKIGFITNTIGNNGFSGNDSINIHLITGQIWSVNRKFIYEILTKEEVETALIAEAKRRGFKEGVHKPQICLLDGCVWNEHIDLSDLVLEYDEEGEFMLGTSCIFKDGKWAEIVEEPKVNEITIPELELLTGLTNIKIIK